MQSLLLIALENHVLHNSKTDFPLQGVGHGNPSMSMALAEAAGRYGHVMFPSNLHPPAVQLAQYLLEKGPGRDWADRVFYSG